MALSIAEAGMVAAGALVGGVGLWLLFMRRPKSRGEMGTAIPRLTEPTRLVLAAICVMVGYHLIVWAFPAHVAAVQLPRGRWYVWILIGMAMVLLTLQMDKMDRDRASRPSTRDGDRP